MIRFISLALLLCFSSEYTLAQNSYAILFIPPDLVKEANVVKRMEEVYIDIKDIGKATITRKYCVTILNKAGDDQANLELPYSKFISVSSVDGTLYDAMGKKIKSLKKADIKDYSNTDEGSLADDSRVKEHNFNYNVYPYSVEYEIVTKLNGIFFIPAWMPVEGDFYAVEKSRLVVECPDTYQIRYKEYNYPGKPVESIEKNRKIFTWELKQQPGIKGSALSPSWFRITPTVFLAPADFEIQDFKGNMNSWKGFGDFIYQLNKDRDQLPENVKNEIHELTNQLPDDKAKVKALYEYLQKNTRYISIQLGIGGWQTFDASYVAQKKYGDCKALSNYMFSMLKEVGIKANHVLIHSGPNKYQFREEFPSNQFNHMILCVPQKKDTIWLECTSQTLPAGYLGNSTSDRPALMIDASGGKMVRTPRYDKKQNTQLRTIAASIDAIGNVKATVHTNYTAWQQDYHHSMLHALSKEKILERLKEHLDIPSYDVTQFSYRENKQVPPSVEEDLVLQLNHYATITGKRLFINPNLMNRFTTVYKEDLKRTVPIEVLNGYTDVDSIVIQVPEGYVAESLPAATNAQSIFGSFSTNYSFEPGKIIYYRRMERNDGKFPPESYAELNSFYQRIAKADKSKIVLVKE